MAGRNGAVNGNREVLRGDIEQYVKDVRNLERYDDVDLLTAEEEKYLGWRIINDNDQEAREKFVKANLRLVISVAKDYKRFYKIFYDKDLSLPDVIEDGNVGLMRAVDKFDPVYGKRFSTYATWWIRQSIRLSLKDEMDVLHLPAHAVETLGKICPYLDDCKEEGRVPDLNKLSEETGRGVDVIRALVECYNRNNRAVSLSYNSEEEYGGLNPDFLEELTVFGRPQEIVSEQDKRRVLQEAIYDSVKNVGSSERDIGIFFARNGSYLDDEFINKLDSLFDTSLIDKVGERPTLKQVGECLGITRERVRQLERKTKKRLAKNRKLRRLLVRQMRQAL